jgi:hypothetical protein
VNFLLAIMTAANNIGSDKEYSNIVVVLVGTDKMITEICVS